MTADHRAFHELEQALRRVERSCAVADADGMDQAIGEVRRALESARRLWDEHRAEARRLAQAQGEAIVNSAMIMTELEDAKSELESEIAERMRAEDRLRHDALHDGLTGLPNRQMLTDRLQRCLDRAAGDPAYSFAVLFLDIDNFKLINDSLGHDQGDELLVETSRRLAGSLREPDSVGRNIEGTAARLGGDEFIILLDGITRPADAVHVAERIQKRISVPFDLGHHRISINASIGIALHDGGCRRAEDLLRNADTAMYRAKLAGKARYALFSEAMHAEVSRRLSIENHLRNALSEQGLRAVYQPIVSLESGRIVGFEVLLRWACPGYGPIGPDEFIPVAEETGLIIPFGRWVQRTACRQLRSWRDRFPSLESLFMSVNVSRVELANPGFVAAVDDLLDETGLEARDLNLELTESVVIEHGQVVGAALEGLSKAGVRLSMDDFGTGYSSLSCLHQFPLDVLKIDRAFVANMAGDREYAAVVDAIVALARNLDMQVTAEGLETSDQLAMVLALGCDFGQGFYFSRPLGEAEAGKLLESDPRWHLEPSAPPRAFHPRRRAG